MPLTLQGKGPSIDTAFAMFQRRRQIKQEMGHSVNVSVLDRIKLEKSKVESTSEAMRARAKQVRQLLQSGWPSSVLYAYGNASGELCVGEAP